MVYKVENKYFAAVQNKFAADGKGALHNKVLKGRIKVFRGPKETEFSKGT